MIYKKRYGQPIDTESVVGSFLPMMETIPYLTKEPDGFSYAMEPQDVLYGLGENVRGINKRGDRKSTRLNSSHSRKSRMPSSA